MPRIKKEDEFYTMLKQVASDVAEASETYVDIISNWPSSRSRVSRMAMHESNTDEHVRAIMTKLYSSFITPFDRSDISDLALAMDDVVDMMEGVTLRLDLFNVQVMRPEAREMADLTHLAIRKMREMIELLPNYKRDEKVMEMAIAVGHVEDGGDAVYESALRRLFLEEETRGKEALAWLRTFDRMEECLDACDHAAHVVRNVVMKSS